MSEKALFDPGFAPMVFDFTDSIETMKTALKDIKIPNQRKFRFKVMQPQVIELVKNSVSFYLGCLMWAKYLKNNYKENEKEIENNPFLGIDLQKEGLSVDIFCAEVNNFLIFCENYSKDCKFFLGKEEHINPNYIKIAQLYKEFLIINNSFIKTKYTSDLVLPENISEILTKSDSDNKSIIDNTITNKNILKLLEVLE